jgi:hypothetical protein
MYIYKYIYIYIYFTRKTLATGSMPKKSFKNHLMCLSLPVALRITWKLIFLIVDFSTTYEYTYCSTETDNLPVREVGINTCYRKKRN